MNATKLALMAGLSVLSMTAASADTVKLTSHDGKMEVTGNLMFVSSRTYVIRTEQGQLSINRAGVYCEGATCPEQDGQPPQQLAAAPQQTAPVPQQTAPAQQARQELDQVQQAFGLVIRGSDTVGEELMPKLVEGYSATLGAAVADRRLLDDNRVALAVAGGNGAGRPLLDVEIQSRGSSTGFQALIDGQTDIAMSSRPVRLSEIRAIAAAGRGNLQDLDQEYIVAVDSILAVVSPSNPVGTLTVAQLADIFSGAITNWAQLGGPNLPVKVYSRDTNSGTFGVFSANVLEPSNRTLTRDARVLASNEDISDAIASDPGGIGYVGFAYAGETRPVNLVANCGLPMEPSVFSAKTEEYLLERRLRLFVDNAQASEHVRGLLDFSVSEAADPLVRDAGFIDLGIVEARADLAQLRVETAISDAVDPVSRNLLQSMQTELTGARRLSTTFRFATGSAILDNKAERDLGRMISYLARPENAGRDVLIVGYTDADGAPTTNAALSQSRAQAVLTALQSHPEAATLSGRILRATGYGELSPVACNDEFEGKKRNRRVEVWVR